MTSTLKKTLLGVTAGLTALAFSNCSTNLYRTNPVDPLYYTPEKQKKEYVTQEEYNSLDSVVNSEKNYVLDTTGDKEQKNNYVIEESQTQTYPSEKDYRFYDFDNDGIIDWNDPWPHRYGPFKDMNNNHIVDFQDWQISGFTNPWAIDYQFNSGSWYDFYGRDYMSNAWFWREPMIGWKFGWSSWSSPWYTTSNWRHNWWNSWSYWDYNDDFREDDYEPNRRRKPVRDLKTRIRKTSEDYDNEKRINTNRPNRQRIIENYREDESSRKERSVSDYIRKNRENNERDIQRRYERPERESVLEREWDNQRTNRDRIRKIEKSNSKNNIQIRHYNSNSTNEKNNSTNNSNNRVRKSNSSSSNSNSSSSSGRKKR